MDASHHHRFTICRNIELCLYDKILENCSSHNKKHSLPTEWTNVPLHDLSHARYLTHATCCYRIATQKHNHPFSKLPKTFQMAIFFPSDAILLILPQNQVIVCIGFFWFKC